MYFHENMFTLPLEVLKELYVKTIVFIDICTRHISMNFTQ